MLKYRPDIDGLRAVAVGSVVLYHLDESLVSGGFVGVDIFFVISGYLITKLIIGELGSADGFSFKKFYVRRMRRLFPALFATVLACLVTSYFLLSPTHLMEFGQSLVAAILSVSNLFFWSVAGYFDSDSTLKPLLHTWSLSVEEQFYLLWPAVLVVLYSLKRPRLIPVFILVVGSASWLLNEVFFGQQAVITNWFGTQDNQSALDVPSTVFYWLPFRVFEFSIGAILIWFTNPIQHRRYSGEVLFSIGLALLVWSIVAYDNTIEFPSSAALLPCLGAALIIASGPAHRLSFILANRGMVGVGLISYSLYLVHWPIIVFYKYWAGREFSNTECVFLILVALILAYLMYRFIEQPFRRVGTASSNKVSPNRAFLLGSLASVIAIISISVNAASQGWLWRYPAEVVAQLSYKKGDYTQYFWANIHKYSAGYSNNGKPKVLVVGDSMAAALMNVLVAADTDQEIDLASILVGENCKTIFGLSEQKYNAIYAGRKEVCKNEHSRVLARLELLSSTDTIIIATYWWHKNLLKYVPSTVAHLKTVSDAKIMVLGLNVQQSNGILFLSKHAFSPQIDKLRTPPHPQAIAFNNILKRYADDYYYFDLLDLFCNDDGCQRVTKDGYVVIFDESHLSEKGASFVAKRVKQRAWFQELTQTK